MSDPVAGVTRHVVKIVDLVAQILLASLALVIVLQIGSRFLHMPIKWTVEISRVLFAWLGFLGLVIAIATDSVPRFTFFVEKLPAPVQSFLRPIRHSLVLFFLIVLFFSTFSVVAIAHRQDMALLPFKWSYVYISLPVSLVLLILVYSVKMRADLQDILRSQSRSSNPDRPAS